MKEREQVCRNYQLGGKWFFGRVKKSIEKLHYLIQLDDGQIWKRHINQIRLIGEHTPKRSSFNKGDRYGNYNSDEQDRKELLRKQKIEKSVNLQLRRSRIRAPPQRYGNYETH